MLTFLAARALLALFQLGRTGAPFVRARRSSAPDATIADSRDLMHDNLSTRRQPVLVQEGTSGPSRLAFVWMEGERQQRGGTGQPLGGEDRRARAGGPGRARHRIRGAGAPEKTAEDVSGTERLVTRRARARAQKKERRAKGLIVGPPSSRALSL